MKHYITPNNQTWGFDDAQEDLIPENAVLIPDSYTMDQIPYIKLINGEVTYDKDKHDADLKFAQDVMNEELAKKQAAEAKLAAIGLTPDDLKAILGAK